jgi:rubrerythrin
MTEATLETALRGLGAVGASVDERELVELLTTHARKEVAILERYRRFAAEAASPAARYLVKLIVDDEERHHRLLAELANAIAWEGQSPVPSVPDAFASRDEALVAETQALLDAEGADSRELKRLQRRLEPFGDATMWPLIVDLMLLDTQKHIEILRFIAWHAR